MIQLCRGTSFAEETLFINRGFEHACPRYFDGNDALQLRVASLVHGAETPLTDALQDDKPADFSRQLFLLVRRGSGQIYMEGAATIGADDFACGGGIRKGDAVAAVRAFHITDRLA